MKSGLWNRIAARFRAFGETIVFLEDNRDDLHELRLRRIDTGIAELKETLVVPRADHDQAFEPIRR